MEEKKSNHSVQFLRKRKFLLVIPILVYPFLTLMLFSLGFIGTAKAGKEKNAQMGFNINLPNPIPSKDSNWNKLKFYEEADRDSAKYKSLLKNDPYFQFPAESDTFPGSTHLSPYSLTQKEMSLSYDPYPAELQSYKDPNEAKVYKKLAELERELVKSEAAKKDSEVSLGNDPKYSSTAISDVDRLENMMRQMQSPDLADPELTQLNGMLEKILDIQHPDRLKEKLKAQSETSRGQVFPVAVNSAPDKISLLQSTNRKSSPFDTTR
ncbi:MAG: hypothetical protein E6Q36_07420, partial [Chryseobacterium sp.]